MVMKITKEFHFPHSQKFDRKQKRLWATLLLRLGIKLTELGLANFHECGYDRVISWNSELVKLLQNFSMAAGHVDTTEALKQCIDLCTVKLDHLEANSNAAKLLQR